MSEPKYDISAIYGRVIERAPWLQFPSVVSSKSPDNKTEITEWRIDPTAVHEDFRINIRQTVLDLWSRVLGRCPPMPGAALQLQTSPFATLTSLRDAHACFLGVNRPLGEDDNGDNVLAFITKPRFCFEIRPTMAGVAKILSLPTDVVFVVYVKLDVLYNEAKANLCGVVTHWSTIEADSVDYMLPRDYGVRFERRLW